MNIFKQIWHNKKYNEERKLLEAKQYNTQANIRDMQIATILMRMVVEAERLNSGVMVRDGTVWHNLN